jgi:hypothetical protein
MTIDALPPGSSRDSLDFGILIDRGHSVPVSALDWISLSRTERLHKR